MTNNYYIKNKVYNRQLNDELWDRLSRKEELTKEEHDYMTYCYHYEEWQAGLL